MEPDFMGQVPWIIDGRYVVTVTHPQQPNWSGNARGRKVHIAKDEKVSVCNMLIDQPMMLWADGERPIGQISERRCKVCFAQIKQPDV